MKSALFVVLSVLTLIVAPAIAWSKGATVKLVIDGEGLSSPIEVTEPSIIRSFSIWNGPSVRVNGEPIHMDPDKQHGAFIDWPRGMLAQGPVGLKRYEVSFHIEGRQPPRDRYVVVYAFDRSASGGYMYLPGRGDEHVAGNTWLIYHGVEGNWFYSSSAWEELVRPLIEESSGGRRGQIEPQVNGGPEQVAATEVRG